MNQLEVKFNYTTIEERSGKDVKVSESFLIYAVSYQDAEEQALKIAEEEIGIEIEITAIAKVRFQEIMNVESDKFYKAKIKSTIFDEKSGQEKKVSFYVLVGTDDFEKVQSIIKEKWGISTIPYEIENVSLTKITKIIKIIKEV